MNKQRRKALDEIYDRLAELRELLEEVKSDTDIEFIVTER